jgi:hypothetical protein
VSRIGGSNTLALTIPAGAVAAIVLALLWTIAAIPRVPIVSEIVGLFAVLIAPGLAVEPMFHGERWTLVERLGLAVALSLAITALLGVGLHLVGLPVSPANVMTLVLVVAAPIGALSIRFRRRRPARTTPLAMRREVALGAGSLVLLMAAFISILVLRPAPDGPRLEIMAVDGAGRLLSMPIRSDPGGATVTIALRSASGEAGSASLAVDGDGVRQWSASVVAIGADWTAVAIPVGTTRTGSVLALVTVSAGGTELTLPIAMEVGP